MLVLTRELEDSVYIDLPDGRTISIKVVQLRGDKVRLGFDAPKDVLIRRDNIKNNLPKQR